jgi:hypothetical protein
MSYNFKQLERIIKECYWDYHISAEDLIAILSGEDLEEKRQLFNKILLNSTERLYDLNLLFDKELLTIFLHDFKPKDTQDFFLREVKLLRSILLKEKIEIPELAWKKY